MNTVTIPGWMLGARLAGAPVVCHVHEAEDALPRPVALALHLRCCFRADPGELEGRRERPDRDAAAAGRSDSASLNGVAAPTQASQLQVQNGKVHLLLVGRLSPRKGTDVAIAALEGMIGRGLDASLSLVGEVFPGYEWYERTLREQVSAAGLESR